MEAMEARGGRRNWRILKSPSWCGTGRAPATTWPAPAGPAVTERAAVAGAR
jgi:hypothetical protein